MRATRTTLSSLAAMSVTLTVWGVQPSGATEPQPPSSPAPSSAAAPKADGFSVVAALAELPAELLEDAPYVTMGDVAAVTEAAGLTVPDPTTSDDFVADYVRWMSIITGLSSTPPTEEPEFAPAVLVPPVQMSQMAAMVEDLEAAVGFTFADVEWFVDATLPPSSFSVFGGSFDDSTLAADLLPVDDGIVSLGDGDDLSIDPEAATPLSRIGQPQRLAVLDGRIAVSPDTALVRDWLAGGAPADVVDEDLLAVATALDEAGVVSAALTSLTDFDDALGRRVTAEQHAALLAEVGDIVLDDSFGDAVGIGWNAIDGESVISIAYALDDDADPDTATDRARRLFEDGISIQSRQPLSELLLVDEVTNDGTVVVVTLRPAPERAPLIAVRMLQTGDLPFLVLDD